MPVRAVADGTVVRPCANWVKIRHANGWETGYYHLARIGVHGGERVKAGQLLGYTSTAAGCGGSATGPHVHFSVQRYGNYVSVNGLVLGGWTVRAGSDAVRWLPGSRHPAQMRSDRPDLQLRLVAKSSGCGNWTKI